MKKHWFFSIRWGFWKALQKLTNSSIFLPSGQACFDQAKAFREVVDIGSVETLDEVASRWRDTYQKNDMECTAHAAHVLSTSWIFSKKVGSIWFLWANLWDLWIQIDRFADRMNEVIITKLDGHAKGGGALSAVSATWGNQVWWDSQRGL